MSSKFLVPQIMHMRNMNLFWLNNYDRCYFFQTQAKSQGQGRR